MIWTVAHVYIQFWYDGCMKHRPKYLWLGIMSRFLCRKYSLILLLVVLFSACSLQDEPATVSQPVRTELPTATSQPVQVGLTTARRPNIIFILTDDQDVESIAYMPHLQALIAKQGMTLANSFVTDSLCCPARSTILRSQYTHSHEVLTNNPPQGGFVKFHILGHENSTIASWLQSAGYRTALIGKYLNGYPRGASSTYIPPGWNQWDSVTSGNAGQNYNYQINENGTLVNYGAKPQDYLTDVLAGKATDFIRTNGATPFFMYLATLAPHTPSTPPVRYQDALPDAKAPRTPSFDEQDVSDKPTWIRTLPRLTPAAITALDTRQRKGLQTLLAVDDLVGNVVKALQDTGTLSQTYIFYTTDNGFHLGHHRIDEGKGTAYEEDIRVPLLVRGPSVPAGSVQNDMVLNLDLAPTFADLAGIPTPDFVEGRSFRPVLTNTPPPATTGRQGFLIEHWPINDLVPPYKALRTQRYAYVEYATGERELYDLAKDPYELENIAAITDPARLKQLSAWLASLSDCTGVTCRQIENGNMNISTTDLPLILNDNHPEPAGAHEQR